MIEQAKFMYSPLGRAFEKQTKMIEEQGRKQIEAIEEHGKQLVKSNALIKKKNKVYHQISKKKHSIILLCKELEKLKNYKMLIFKIWCIILRVPLKI